MDHESFVESFVSPLETMPIRIYLISAWSLFSRGQSSGFFAYFFLVTELGVFILAHSVYYPHPNISKRYEVQLTMGLYFLFEKSLSFSDSWHNYGLKHWKKNFLCLKKLLLSCLINPLNFDIRLKGKVVERKELTFWKIVFLNVPITS